MPLSEFDLIERFFTGKQPRRSDVVVGIGDDCALLELPPEHELAVSIDTLVHDVHFPASTPPYDVGYKALAVGLSDLAAMGAQPAWATLALSIPSADERWLQAFSQGFFDLASRYNTELVGGDIVRGPLVVTVQVHGFVPQASALTREGARSGDYVCVSGTLGDAAFALLFVKGQLAGDAPRQILRRLNFPAPRVSLGLALRRHASACIDISDGLAADLGHILKASQVGATLDLEKIPLSWEIRHAVENGIIDRRMALELALTGGDDYELCFTLPQDTLSILQNESEKLLNCCVVGQVTRDLGLRFIGRDAKILGTAAGGFDHFA